MSSTAARTHVLASAVCLAVGLFCVGAPCFGSQQQYEYERPVATGDGWQTASLSDVGIDEASLVALLDAARSRDDHLIHSILLIKDGYLVLEEYFGGRDLDLFDESLRPGGRMSFIERMFSRDELHFAASVTKSVTSVLFGIALDQGHVPGTDATMLSFFPDYANLGSSAKERITIHHMLSMTSGLPFDEQSHPIPDPRNDAVALLFSEDPVAFMLGRDVAHPPGTTYEYNSGTTVLLGEIIRRATGQSVHSFAARHLFEPLQITSYEWAEMRAAPEVAFASGGLYMRPRDMAKIGQLMLQEGVWDGRRVVSADWVRRSVTPAVSIPGTGVAREYGYLWRMEEIGGVRAFLAAGWGGQYVVVLPELHLVYVQTGGRYQGERVPVDYRGIVADYILSAIER